MKAELTGMTYSGSSAQWRAYYRTALNKTRVMQIQRLDIVDDLRKVKSAQEIRDFANEHVLNFPSYFVDFLFNYEGSTIKEYVFFCERGNNWSAINQILFLKKNDLALSIEDCLEFVVKNGKRWLPFANDPGGWLFVISQHEDSKEQVWIYTTEGEMFFVSDSFAVFINGLMTYEEAVVKGY